MGCCFILSYYFLFACRFIEPLNDSKSVVFLDDDDDDDDDEDFEEDDEWED